MRTNNNIPMVDKHSNTNSLHRPRQRDSVPDNSSAHNSICRVWHLKFQSMRWPVSDSVYNVNQRKIKCQYLLDMMPIILITFARNFV